MDGIAVPILIVIIFFRCPAVYGQIKTDIKAEKEVQSKFVISFIGIKIPGTAVFCKCLVKLEREMKVAKVFIAEILITK